MIPSHPQSGCQSKIRGRRISMGVEYEFQDILQARPDNASDDNDFRANATGPLILEGRKELVTPYFELFIDFDPVVDHRAYDELIEPSIVVL